MISGKVLVGIAVFAMIMGPYRITADQKKPDAYTAVKKVKGESVKDQLKIEKTSLRLK